MKVMRDGTIKITEADVADFARMKRRDGDLLAINDRIVANRRKREIRAFNALDTWEREELFPSSN